MHDSQSWRGKRHENAASSHCRRCTARERSLGRTMPNVLRRVCRISLVPDAVSVMKTTLIAGVAALLIATSAARADTLDWDKLHAATVALYGECDLDLRIAG